ncbi:Phenylalanine-specific permease [Cedecea davisae]|nr:Phenylalanine-specific permease [Cedecea davisae]
MMMILGLMCTIDEMRVSALLLPVWIVFLFAAFKLLRRKVA